MWGRRQKRHFYHYHWLLFIFFYAICTNIPYWIACHEIGLLRLGWFCIEYALVGLLALLAPRLLVATLLLLVMVADFLSGILLTYQVSIAQSLTNTGVYYSIPVRRQLAVILFALLALFMTASAAFVPAFTVRKDHRWRVAVCLIAFVVISLSVDGMRLYCATGHIPNPLHSEPKMLDKFGMNRYSALRLARIPTVRVYRNMLTDIELRAMIKRDGQSQRTVDSAAAQALRFAKPSIDANMKDKPNLVLILVESWGISSNASIRSALIQPYLQPELLNRYSMTQGTVPFYGGTIAGEARELCGNSIGLYLLEASASELHGCLPERMAARGYNNIAVHGMSGNMFERSTWWKTVGFNETWFKERLQEQGLPNCYGAFAGTCDSSIAEWIGNRLENKDADPDFVYWVTLNSHLPVLVPSPLKSGAPCGATLSLSPDTPLCSWYQLIANLHQSVARLAMSKLNRPTVFVIVGDHTPPFADSNIARQFSSTIVPYIVLSPRQKEMATK